MRDIIRDAMMERIEYMITGGSGDLSVKSAVLIDNGAVINMRNEIASPVEREILLNAGLLHRGEWRVVINPEFIY